MPFNAAARMLPPLGTIFGFFGTFRSSAAAAEGAAEGASTPSGLRLRVSCNIGLPFADTADDEGEGDEAAAGVGEAVEASAPGSGRERGLRFNTFL